MPDWSTWHMVLSTDGADWHITVYPDMQAGISGQFPHQALNVATDTEAAWRSGAPCLERPVSAFHREGWSGEPSEFEERLYWYIGRLFAWIDAAAQNRLIDKGEPIELPVLPNAITRTLIGFWEDSNSHEWWANIGSQWGFANLSRIPGSLGTSVVVDFMNAQRVSICRPPWGLGISAPNGSIDAVWMVMPVLAIGQPWRLPSTWEEFAAFCTEVSVELPLIISDAGAALRRIERPKKATTQLLLVGFPIPEIKGEAANRMHWIAFGNMKTARRADVRHGFSNRAGARRIWDKTLALETRSISYIPTANWAPDQLRRRGEAEADVRLKSMLVVGGGALGGAVVENLVRMGVSDIGIVDPDHLTVGNLSRHVLSMNELGFNKANALAKNLNATMPDINVRAFGTSFPPKEESEREKFYGWDVIIDCTGEDSVLRAMADFPWDGLKTFISLSMTWRARGLVAFADEQTAFPAIEAIDHFFDFSEKPDNDTIRTMEGIGCWHPVFPASVDDVQLWAAVGTKFIRRAVLERRRICEHFVQDEYGAIKRHAA
ncbi:ThiF family adenylyltransferase [Brucella sp. 21LCYQ03]|nr:ThiF family adenylyltransferase [Brucella sp. 21LCYQ03]